MNLHDLVLRKRLLPSKSNFQRAVENAVQGYVQSVTKPSLAVASSSRINPKGPGRVKEDMVRGAMLYMERANGPDTKVTFKRFVKERKQGSVQSVTKPSLTVASSSRNNPKGSKRVKEDKVRDAMLYMERANGPDTKVTFERFVKERKPYVTAWAKANFGRTGRTSDLETYKKVMEIIKKDWESMSTEEKLPYCRRECATSPFLSFVDEWTCHNVASGIHNGIQRSGLRCYGAWRKLSKKEKMDTTNHFEDIGNIDN